MPAFAFLLLASNAAARVASLNLCTDEYLLLLARPEAIVSVSYLSQDSLESPLWRSARRFKGNRGSLEDILPQRPTLVLTMGGGGRATAFLSKRLGIRVIDLPFATDLNGVAVNRKTVASALEQPAHADSWIRRLHELRASTPSSLTDAIWVSGGGQSLTAGSLGTQWLRFAGFQQRALPDGRATLETLLTSPPKVLIKSDYRSGQMSGGNRWLDHPIVRRAATEQIATDGRPWTCLGPLMIPEIERLRRIAR